MIERLHYLAVPKVEESPRSVLLRTVTHNGYRSISQLGTKFRLISVPPFTLQIGQAPLIRELSKEAGEYKERFLSAFYMQEKSITKAAPIRVMGTKVPSAVIMGFAHKVCPLCLQEEHLRPIQDFEWVDVCPYHNIRYIFACPRCETPFQWTAMQLSRCRCGFELDPYQLPRIEGDPYGAKTLLEYLRNGDEQGIRELQSILDALKFDRCSEPSERICLFNQAAMICSNLEQGLQGWLVIQQNMHPGLPVRVLLAPFLAIQEKGIRVQAYALLQSSSADFPSKCRECKCQGKFLSDMETRTALGISSATLASLVNSGHLEKMTVGKRGVEYSYPSLCSFFSTFRTSSATQRKKAMFLCEPNSFGVNLATKINQLQKKELILVEADAREPIGKFLVAPHETDALAQRRVTLEGYMTINDVANRLRVYSDAVRRALKAGHISNRIKIGKLKTIFIPDEDVSEFEKDYVFIGSLSRQYNAKTTAFSAQLATAGILPVSGPGIDEGLVPIYRLEALTGHDLVKIAAMPKFKTRAGRKKGDTECYDRTQWIRASDVGRLLEIPIQQLSILKDYGLLEEGVPLEREADNTRYFTAKSVNMAKQWLAAARPVGKVARGEGLSPFQIQQRFIQSGYVKPLYLRKRTLISAEDAKRIQKHHKLYCSCSEAAHIVGAQMRHFHNMIKLGKISPVPVKESGVDSIVLLRLKDVIG